MNIGAMVLAILPEIGLLLLAGVVLAFDLAWRASRRWLGWLTAGGSLVVVLLSIFFARPEALQGDLLFGGMLRLDATGFVFRLIFVSGAGLTALFAMHHEIIGNRGEFYALMLISTLGMSLMAGAADLIMLFLAIETTSLPLYILAGFLTRDEKSVEAGIKYMLYGAVTSAVMLYGFSLLYGFTGTTNLYQIAGLLQPGGGLPPFGPVLALLLVLVGFGFKISAVPFHFWAPDVYEGAPTPVTGFLSTASKAAGFVVLMRVLVVAFPDLSSVWQALLIILAIGSMFVGNLLALAQKNVKRLLAYSSIAQAGYMLIGVAVGSPLGLQGTIYYLMAYLLTNLAVFGVVAAISQQTGSDELASYQGFSRRSPGLALALLVGLLSLGGVPPFAGFIGKLLVFGSAVQANLAWLAFIGVLNAVIGLYYYLTVLRVVYAGELQEEEKPVTLTLSWRVALVLCVTGIVVLGVILIPAFNLSQGAALGLVLF
ncbi:MAG TPA: NADH-quinone oxidoreductase subunit N [Anaerolineaceae bacterium]|nr:NADH-quinone oxidoreductase subunit N [Anaerolineaceae bacterium]